MAYEYVTNDTSSPSFVSYSSLAGDDMYETLVIVVSFHHISFSVWNMKRLERGS